MRLYLLAAYLALDQILPLTMKKAQKLHPSSSSFHFMLGTSAHSHSCPSNITFPRGQVINRLGFKGLPYMEREQKRGN